ncbi:MAG: hypothetical protein CL489_15480 [Acidobacteria bacterium]|nr:hypothetical protein [Acidobacteriota bacterium]
MTTIMEMKRKDLRPLPELIRRKDGANDEPAEWDIHPCAAERGAPMTAVIPRIMNVPIQDFELDRVIRAHEMMHAKVSPGNRQPWIDRGIATDRAMIVAEEARVNFLVAKAGFDVDILEDGTEMNAGERISQRGDWAEAVYFVAAISGTGGLNKYLVGIRRHRPAWSPRLRRISQLIQKEFRRIDRTRYETPLSSTKTASGRLDPEKELVEGYFHTESIAEWLDRLAEEPHEDEPEDEQDEESADSNDSEDGEDKVEDDDEEGGGVGNEKEGDHDCPLSKQDLESQQPVRKDEAGSWAQLNVMEQNLTRHVPGGLGKKRIASNMGRNPRRIGRMFTDPQKRIFDRKVKGNGGVVLIDYSGSMSLSEKDVLDIMDAAPGCTVACYTTNSHDKDGRANLWVLGARGRMTTNIPRSRGGNGVDHPALVWAVQQKQRRNAPLVWVTDGGVVGPGQGYRDQLAMQCIKTCLKSNVVIRDNVEKAVELLNAIAAQKPIKKWWPLYFRTTYKRQTGHKLEV